MKSRRCPTARARRFSPRSSRGAKVSTRRSSRTSAKPGFQRVRADGEVYDLEEDITLDRYGIHNIEVVVDRLVIRHYDDPDSEDARSAETRLTEAIETALEMGGGVVIVNNLSADPPTDMLFSELLACVNGHGSLPEIEPRTFSFNTPKGACPDCQGLGFRLELDRDLIVPNPELSIVEGAIDTNGWNAEDPNSWGGNIMRSVAETYHIPIDKPWRELTREQQDVFLYGTGGRKVRVRYTNSQRRRPRIHDLASRASSTILQRRYRETDSD